MEYMVHVWGGMFNKDAYPSITKDLGITEGYYYFNTEQEKNDFLNKIRNPIYKNQGCVTDVKCGKLSHKRTVFHGTFEYEGKRFEIDYNFGYEFPEKNAVFMFTEGNYSCDCNRSDFIRDKYGEDSIKELRCGYKIKLIEYYITYED